MRPLWRQFKSPVPPDCFSCAKMFGIGILFGQDCPSQLKFLSGEQTGTGGTGRGKKITAAGLELKPLRNPIRLGEL